MSLFSFSNRWTLWSTQRSPSLVPWGAVMSILYRIPGCIWTSLIWTDDPYGWTLSASRKVTYITRESNKTIHPRYGNQDSEIRENFTCAIRNPGLWNSEYSSREDWSLVPGIRNPHGVESSLQDCHGFPYVGETNFMEHILQCSNEMLSSGIPGNIPRMTWLFLGYTRSFD